MTKNVEDPGQAQGRLSEPFSFQIIVLGSGGGPNEDNVTGLLVRSTATNWAKGSLLAVDAGTHLAAIIRILEQHLPKTPKLKSPGATVSGPKTPPRTRSKLVGNGGASPAVSSHPSSGPIAEATGHVTVQRAPPAPFSLAEDASHLTRLSDGPFAGLGLPFQTAKANAAYITRTLVSTYLITHPHLDHLSGFAVNTASFQHTYQPKCLAALPSTIDAVKDHIFNDVIWPNLSDEDGGVGLVTYMRLVEGGNVALGTGDGMGYIEVCDGLGVKCWSISHGHCMKRHSHRGTHSDPHSEAAAHITPLARNSTSSDNLGPARGPQHAHHLLAKACVYDSSAFFIRDHSSGNEVLIFGDVEPDSLSLSPRTAQVWRDAAPKIVAGLLKGIFIECSYDDSQSDQTLFGHLCPRHLIAELQALAAAVVAIQHPPTATATAAATATASARKRKRHSNGLQTHAAPDLPPRRTRNHHRAPRTGAAAAAIAATVDASVSVAVGASEDPLPTAPASVPATGALTAPSAPPRTAAASKGPLESLKVVIIHMKDTLTDGPAIGDSILAQLLEYEKVAGLGCSFVISESGTSVWL